MTSATCHVIKAKHGMGSDVDNPVTCAEFGNYGFGGGPSLVPHALEREYRS